MVLQQKNQDEWNDYYNFWMSKLDPSKGDICTAFNIHNTGGRVEEYEAKRIKEDDSEATLEKYFAANSLEARTTYELVSTLPKGIENLTCLDPHVYEKASLCPDIFTRLSIFASGRIALCSADQAEYHPIGNILDFESPVEAFNSEYFDSYRKSWMNRDISCKNNCKECTIAVSRFMKHA